RNRGVAADGRVASSIRVGDEGAAVVIGLLRAPATPAASSSPAPVVPGGPSPRGPFGLCFSFRRGSPAASPVLCCALARSPRHQNVAASIAPQVFGQRAGARLVARPSLGPAGGKQAQRLR